MLLYCWCFHGQAWLAPKTVGIYMCRGEQQLQHVPVDAAIHIAPFQELQAQTGVQAATKVFSAPTYPHLKDFDPAAILLLGH